MMKNRNEKIGMRNQPMKICIVLVDCMRPDHLGCYGYPGPTSPEIDAIAEKSTVFKRAYAQSNWTYPSVYSMMTGRYPSTLGISWFDQKLNPAFIVLPEYLEQLGFHTGIFSNFRVLLNPDSFCSHFKEMRKVQVNDEGVDAFSDWIEGHTRSLLMFHIGEYVHEPFFADKDLVSLFLPPANGRPVNDDMSRTVQTLTSKSVSGNTIRSVISRINRRMTRLSPDELTYLLACYDAGIRQVDRFIGKLHRILQEKAEDYLLIITADHGQAFCEHKVFGHGLSLYEELIRVPLIVQTRGGKPGVVEGNARLMDLFPTVIELLDMPLPGPVDGISFAHCLQGGSMPDLPLLAEGYPNLALIKNDYKLITSYSRFWDTDTILRYFSEDDRTRSWRKNLMSRVLRYKPVSLFNLKNDGLERHNIARQEKGRIPSLNAEIEKILTRIERDRKPPVKIDLDKQIKNQLERLGYL
jgi:arylsulfatase A-like enzyme